MARFCEQRPCPLASVKVSTLSGIFDFSQYLAAKKAWEIVGNGGHQSAGFQIPWGPLEPYTLFSPRMVNSLQNLAPRVYVVKI